MINWPAFLAFVGMGCAARELPNVVHPEATGDAAIDADPPTSCNFGSHSPPPEQPCGWEQIQTRRACSYFVLRGKAFLHPSLVSALLGPEERWIPVTFRAKDVPDGPALLRWYQCAGKYVVVEGELKRDQAIPNTRRRGDLLVVRYMARSTM